jgi:hypothetical protein
MALRHRPRYDLTLMAEKILEEAEFSRCQAYLMAAPAHEVSRRVEYEICDPKFTGLIGGVSPEQRP